MEEQCFQDDEITISLRNKVETYSERMGNNNYYKNNIIGQYLSTAAGRQRLAASMVQPLRTRLDYVGIARKCLVVDQLPQGALPTYDKDIDISSCITSDYPDDEVTISCFNKVKTFVKSTVRRSLPYQAIARRAAIVQFEDDEIVITSDQRVVTREERNRVTIPSFQIYSNPTVRIGDVKRRRFNLIDRNIQKAKQEIMAQEDSSIFDALDKIAVTKE